MMFGIALLNWRFKLFLTLFAPCKNAFINLGWASFLEADTNPLYYFLNSS